VRQPGESEQPHRDTRNFIATRHPRRRPNSNSRKRRVGSVLGASAVAQAALGTQPKALVGKTSDRKAVGVRAPGTAAVPA